MARPLRIEFPGAWYHAMNWGLNQYSIFLHNSDYEIFITVVKEACKLLMSLSPHSAYYQRKQAVKIYKNFVEQSTDSGLEKFYSKRNQSSILGGKGFINNIKKRFLYSDKDFELEIKDK